MDSPLQWQILPTDIPEGGLAIDRSASPSECAAVATALEIPACRRLRVKGLATSSALHLTIDLTFEADLTQICVVTLEPMETSATGTARVKFARSAMVHDTDDFDPTAEDDEESLENGVLPLGRIVYEELACRIDPYPRKPGVDFKWQDPSDVKSPVTPFAKLAVLKTRPDGT